MTPFENASALSPADGASPGHRLLAAHVPDGWQQDRGAFGGLVMGILVRAMEETHGDAMRRLRTLTGAILAPVKAGATLCDVELLRVGRSVSTLDARLLQQGVTVARASASFGAARANLRVLRPTPPGPPQEAEVEPVEVGPPLGPVFGQHYVYRPLPPFPFAGGTEACSEGFIRARHPPPQLDVAHLMGLLDAWWPAQFAIESAPRAMSTLAFSAQLVVDPARLDATRALRHRARVEAAAEGYVVELRELWQDHQLVALNQQTFVVVR